MADMNRANRVDVEAELVEALPVDEAALAASVLDVLRPFVSSTLLDAASTALTPIVKAALKPAETVEKIVTKTVTLDAAGAAVEPAFTPAEITGNTTLGKLFGFSGRHRHAAFQVDQWNAADAPRIDAYYVPEPSTLAQFVTRAERSQAVWLAGPAGTGKSTMPEQYAARAGRPFVAIAFQRAIDPVDLIGTEALIGGNTVWKDGLLTRSIRRPGMVIMLDEITSAPPGLLMILQTLLSSRTLTLPTGERVECAEGVTFVAADNTAGYGDETGLYSGTMAANVALVDRFALVIPVDYLPVDLEASALVNRTQAPKDACRRVVEFIGSARKLPGFENYPLSLRRMVAFVSMVADGFKVDESFNLAFLTRLPAAEREALRMHYASAFVSGAFESEMHGTPVPAAPSSDPAQVIARSVFDDVDSN